MQLNLLKQNTEKLNMKNLTSTVIYLIMLLAFALSSCSEESLVSSETNTKVINIIVEPESLNCIFGSVNVGHPDGSYKITFDACESIRSFDLLIDPGQGVSISTDYKNNLSAFYNGELIDSGNSLNIDYESL